MKSLYPWGGFALCSQLSSENQTILFTVLCKIHLSLSSHSFWAHCVFGPLPVPLSSPCLTHVPLLFCVVLSMPFFLTGCLWTIPCSCSFLIPLCNPPIPLWFFGVFFGCLVFYLFWGGSFGWFCFGLGFWWFVCLFFALLVLPFYYWWLCGAPMCHCFSSGSLCPIPCPRSFLIPLCYAAHPRVFCFVLVVFQFHSAVFSDFFPVSSLLPLPLSASILWLRGWGGISGGFPPFLLQQSPFWGDVHVGRAWIQHHAAVQGLLSPSVPSLGVRKEDWGGGGGDWGVLM